MTPPNKKPWPTKQAMEQIYQNNLWGGCSGQCYSGSGSHDLALVSPYLEAVTQFLSSFEHPLSICDLGCGDFNVGRHLVPSARSYIAVDIAQNVIDHNQSRFKAEGLEFHCLDIAKDALPKADCALLRQVLQHLSNQEVGQIVPKLSAYQYVILTEHLPSGDFVPNLDLISGQGIRLKKHSGLDLRAAPFGFEPQSEKHLLTSYLNHQKEKIVTTLYQLF